MMVMVMYSLDGTAYGGTYDNFIGALWVAPNRIQDQKMNCMRDDLTVDAMAGKPRLADRRELPF